MEILSNQRISAKTDYDDIIYKEFSIYHFEDSAIHFMDSIYWVRSGTEPTDVIIQLLEKSCGRPL